jgi:hypothetical protein
MDELFRMMTVRAPGQGRDRTVVTIAPASFHTGADPSAELRTFLAGRQAVDLDPLRLGPRAEQVKTLSDQITVNPSADLAQLTQAIKVTFGGKTAPQLVRLHDFVTLRESVADNVVALLIAASLDGSVAVSRELADRLSSNLRFSRVINLVQRVGSADPNDPLTPTTPADSQTQASLIQQALNAPILLPALIFPLVHLEDRSIQSIGYADLLVVKEHIIGYEAGEIARIENILRGETSSHKYRHGVKTDTTTVTTTETATEDMTEIQQTEHLALHNETSNTIKEDLSAKGDVHISYDNVVKFSAGAEVSWSQSKETAIKSATDYAKDVTTRASNKVTRKFSEQVTHRITETLKDIESHGFSNTGSEHIRGVYQWLTAVYEAQIFSYGNRILLDMLVPEPAAFLRSTAVQQAANAAPIAPMLFTLRPDEILDKLPDPSDTNVDGTNKYPSGSKDPAFKNDQLRYFGALASLWGLTDVEAPPEESLVLTKLITGAGDKASSDTAGEPQTVEIKIKPGFRAARGRISAVLTHDATGDSSDAGLWAAIGAIDESSWSATAGRTRAILDRFEGVRGYIGDPGSDKISQIMGISNGLVFIKYVRKAAIDSYNHLKNPPADDPGDPEEETVTSGTVTFDLGYDDYVPKYQPTQAQVPIWDPPVLKPATFFQETDSIAVALLTNNVKSFSVHLEIHCERSPKALADWQAKIFSKIQTIYQKQKQNYDDKMAALAFQGGNSQNSFVLGANVDENRKVEINELKKSIIQYLLGPTAPAFDLDFNNMSSNPPASKNVQEWGAPEITSPTSGFDTTNTELYVSGSGVIGGVVTVTDGGTMLGSFPVDDAGNWGGIVTLGFGPHILIATQRYGVVFGVLGAARPSAPSIVSGVVRPVATSLAAELPYPQPIRPIDRNFARAVRFMEQAFEWENMSSFLYPYYWGRKGNWYDLMKFTSEDPLHQRFLRAGAARVVLAVRPTFNADVLFFLISGKLFISGDVPHIGEPDYFPITDEIKADSDALLDPVPVLDENGKPERWEIRIPTTFLWLRKDDKKPAWQPRSVEAPPWQPPELKNWSWREDKLTTDPGETDPFGGGE